MRWAARHFSSPNAGHLVVRLPGMLMRSDVERDMVPRFLFRGDADPHEERKLRSVYPDSFHGFLLTNLSNGGSGREIFTGPLVAAANRHVGVGWPKTHFLSF